MQKWQAGLIACSMLFGVAACDNDGPLENAGEELDEAADDIGDAVD